MNLVAVFLQTAHGGIGFALLLRHEGSILLPYPSFVAAHVLRGALFLCIQFFFLTGNIQQNVGL
ncbi:hypothetical protein CA603_34600 [Paraburkholderia hospita]|nr:hypothetical protein CA603_34600 [Paraburkholderia hospita]